MKRIIAAMCAALCTVSLFSCGSSDTNGGEGHMYSVALKGNPQSLDPQFAEDESSATVIKNLYSGLMQTDKDGNLSVCTASDYNVSADGLVYTFDLREDNYWFFDENDDDVIDDGEYFPVTAADYVFALKRLLDPQMKSPYAKDFACIKNGEKILSGQLSPDDSGIVAKSDTQLEITLDYPCAEFLKLLSTQAAFPCNEKFFLSTKGRYGLDDRSVMSNGPFYVRQWFYDPYGSNNILYMRKNSTNVCESYEVLPSYVSFSIEDTESDIKKLFKDGEAECFTSLRSSGYNTKKYSVSGTKATTLGLIFNPDDKVFSHAEMRRTFAYSIDREALAEQVGSDVQVAYGIIPPAVRQLGRSYRDLSSDKQFDCYDMDKAAASFDRAETALGNISFDNVKILVCSSTVDSGYIHYLVQSWQDTLGFYVGIEEVTQSEFYQRIEEGDYKIALYPVRGTFNSGLSVIDQFETVECLKSGYGSDPYTYDILHCDSVSELVDRYTAAEKAILSEYRFIPLFYKNSYLIAHKDNDDIIYDPFSGAVDYRLARNYS